MKKKILGISSGCFISCEYSGWMWTKGNTTESLAAPAETTAESSQQISAEESTTADAGSAAWPVQRSSTAWKNTMQESLLSGTETDLQVKSYGEAER